MSWDHEFEYRTEDGLSLDMAQPASRTAVEFDGPWHYLSGGAVAPRETTWICVVGPIWPGQKMIQFLVATA